MINPPPLPPPKKQFIRVCTTLRNIPNLNWEFLISLNSLNLVFKNCSLIKIFIREGEDEKRTKKKKKTKVGYMLGQSDRQGWF